VGNGQVQSRMRAAQTRRDLAHTSSHSPIRRLSPAQVHELNQPLAALTNYISAARRWLRSPDGAERALPLLDKAAEQTARAGALIQDLRNAEGREPDPAMHDVNDMIRQAIVPGLGLPADRAVNLDLGTDLPAVYADRARTLRMIADIVKFAAATMCGPAWRRLVIRSRRVGDGVEVSVANAGPSSNPACRTVFSFQLPSQAVK